MRDAVQRRLTSKLSMLVQLSELQPNCMRRSLASTSFRCSILAGRVDSSAARCAARASLASSIAFKAAISSNRSAALSMPPSLRGL